VTNSSTLRRRWRSWLQQIDKHMFEKAYIDKAMFERYGAIHDGNVAIQTPGNFHNWVFSNYAHSLVLQIRKIADTNQKAVSLRRLVGQIAQHPDVLTKRSFLSKYGRRFTHLGEANWLRYCNGRNCRSIPRGVAHQDLKEIDRLATSIIDYANKEIAHHERGRRYRTLWLDKAFATLDGLLAVCYKYGDLCGQPVPCPYSIVDHSGWDEIFKQPWIIHGSAAPNTLLHADGASRCR